MESMGFVACQPHIRMLSSWVLIVAAMLAVGALQAGGHDPKGFSHTKYFPPPPRGAPPGLLEDT